MIWLIVWMLIGVCATAYAQYVDPLDEIRVRDLPIFGFCIVMWPYIAWILLDLHRRIKLPNAQDLLDTVLWRRKEGDK